MEGEGRMEQREQCTHGRELVHCSFPASHPSLTFPVGGIEAVFTVPVVLHQSEARQCHTVFWKGSQTLVCSSSNLGLNQCKDIHDADMTPHAHGFMT